MSIEEIYKISEAVGNKILRNNRHIPLSYEDVAHDVYIQCFEGGGNFSRPSVIKLLHAIYHEQIKIASNHNGLDNIPIAKPSTEKVCTRCGENKNINEFTLQKEKHCDRYSSLCNKCRCNKIMQWQRKNDDKEKKRKQKRYQNNKHIYDKRNADARKNLVDWYVKKALVVTGSDPNMITPEMIIEKRKQLLQRRSKRAA